jgi:Family of unknown function (DUF6167)
VRRAFWFVAGAASGVYGMVKVRRTLENFTPDGVGARVAAAKAGARMFADQVSAGMNEREADLLAELRANAAEHREIEQAPPPSPVDEIPPQIAREGITDGHR